MGLWGLIMFINLQSQIEINSTNEIPEEIQNTILHDSSEYLNDKIYINQFSLNELTQFRFLSINQCQQILVHRKKYGYFINAQELIHCGIDLEIIHEHFQRFLFDLPFDAKLKSLFSLNEPKASLNVRLKPPTFNQPKSAVSSLWGFEGKLQYKLNQNCSFGFCIENDAYEKPIDYWSFYLHIKKLHPISNLILGKYLVQWNKGFTLGNSGQFGSPNLLENWTYQLVGIKPYASYNEDLGHYGVAAQFLFKEIEFHCGTGFLPIDCKLNSSNKAFEKRLFGGYHQTQSAIQTKHNNVEFQTFLGIQKNLSWANINLLAVRYAYQIPKTEVSNNLFQNSFYFFEGQITVPEFLGGRWMAQASYDKSSNEFCFSQSGVWPIQKRVDFGFKYQSIPAKYNAPEMAYSLITGKNQNSFEMGLDFQISKKTLVKMRSQISSFIAPQISQEINEVPLKTTLFWTYNFSKTDIATIVFRREHELFAVKGNLFQLQINQKMQMSSKTNFHFSYIQKWNNTLNDRNYLIQVGMDQKIHKKVVFSIENNWFHCPTTNIYNLDNSLAGGLAYMIYSNQGNYMNAIVKLKLHRDLSLNIKLQKMQKMDVKNVTNIDADASYSRIFVQITFQ